MLQGAAVVVLLVVVVVFWLVLPVPTVDEIRDMVAAFGFWGGLVFVVGYGLASLVPIPKSVVSIAAGLVWGLGLGVLLVTVASMLGAALAFFIGRGLGQDLLRRIMGDHLRRADEALSDHGLKALILLRLIPVLPFTVINYSAGLTRVSRRDYALGTLIGTIPGTVVFVAIGAYGFHLGWPFFAAVAAVAAVGGAAWLLVRRRQAATAAA
ncbi:TVP38/TMEM64 family protein [Arenivirga flava]|uniref:TVP38/TMEM64 family membrane protein n=1 Tax=Arenivirga flava TaxID=1930060 RepID=A0AA37UHS7_9MICO|nr:TVP38/TMEM64 family protein [Arenivirga flava]GMA29470.1 hypothetical protein GCM10025874_27230 [Arenivirga flava]